MKFATVFGARSSNSLTSNFPSVVVKCAIDIVYALLGMRSYRFLQLDVFTQSLFGGNQLAVFTDGRGLSTETMQAVAKEMNFSETTFVLPPETPGTDFRLRIFTPASELPMAGHPTIGSAFALAHTGAVEAGRESFVFDLGIGPTPVTLTWRDGDLGFA